MGVCVEPPEYVLGTQHFEQKVFRTAAKGEKSGPDDVDGVIYSLRKWTRLAKHGNPSILAMLFAPDRQVCLSYGHWLLESAPFYVSRECGKRFLGYMYSQHQKMQGLKHNRVQRPELVAEHGYDTKFASHAIRLGFQGVEYLTTSRMSLPMQPHERDYVLSIRRGEVPLAEVIERSNELQEALQRLIDSDDIPAEADAEKIDEMLIDIHFGYWEESFQL